MAGQFQEAYPAACEGEPPSADAADSPESKYLGAPVQEVPELAAAANPITLHRERHGAARLRHRGGRFGLPRPAPAVDAPRRGAPGGGGDLDADDRPGSRAWRPAHRRDRDRGRPRHARGGLRSLAPRHATTTPALVGRRLAAACPSRPPRSPPAVVSAAHDRPAGGMGQREFIVLISLLMALTALAIDLMLPAFGAMRESFGLAEDSSSIAPVVTVFLLGLGVGQPLWGPSVRRLRTEAHPVDRPRRLRRGCRRSRAGTVARPPAGLALRGRAWGGSRARRGPGHGPRPQPGRGHGQGHVLRDGRLHPRAGRRSGPGLGRPRRVIVAGDVLGPGRGRAGSRGLVDPAARDAACGPSHRAASWGG